VSAQSAQTVNYYFELVLIIMSLLTSVILVSTQALVSLIAASRILLGPVSVVYSQSLSKDIGVK
jgi:hypothetical protein